MFFKLSDTVLSEIEHDQVVNSSPKDILYIYMSSRS